MIVIRPGQTKQPQTMMPSPPYFTVGMRCWRWCAEPFLLHTYRCVFPPKNSFHLSTGYFASSAEGHPGSILQTSSIQHCLGFFFDSNGFLHGVLPCNAFQRHETQQSWSYIFWELFCARHELCKTMLLESSKLKTVECFYSCRATLTNTPSLITLLSSFN